MKKTFCYFFIIIFSFLSSFNDANEVKLETDTSLESDQETTFYSISSLQFYLEKLLTGNETIATDEIIFQDEDINRLWEQAYFSSDTTSLIDDAYIYYCQAINYSDDKELFNHFCSEANKQLYQAWQKLNKQVSVKTGSQFYPNFDDNPNLDEAMRQRMRPYLLPLDHPAKLFLDKIFKKANAIQDFDTFTDLGFVKIAKHTSHCIVAKHPDLGKYVFKVYLFTETRQKQNVPGWEALTMRCEGAENIRKLIKKKKLRFFTVPDKWLYVLPPEISTPSNPDQKTQLAILVATKAPIESSTTAWKNVTTRQHLDELYCILSHGYGSTHFETNVPYLTSKKFSFIDTEHPKRLLKYEKVKRYLTPKMQEYWDELVRKGGSPKF